MTAQFIADDLLNIWSNFTTTRYM